MPRTIDVDFTAGSGVLKRLFGSAALIAVLFALLVVGCGSFHIVPAGHRGVKWNMMSGIVPRPFDEGFVLKIPMVESVFDIDVRIDKVEPHASAASKDLQMVATTVALNFRPDPEQIHVLYQTVGMSYRERIVDPAIQEAVKSVTALYTAEELITKREEVKAKIQESLVERLRNEHIIVIALNITDFQFSQAFNAAIEEKQTAEQHALKARRDLERIKIEAEQRVAQARAEAEAQRMLAASITSQVVELKRIEVTLEAVRKWDGKMPQVASGALPFWDVQRGAEGR